MYQIVKGLCACAIGRYLKRMKSYCYYEALLEIFHSEEIL